MTAVLREKTVQIRLQNITREDGRIYISTFRENKITVQIWPPNTVSDVLGPDMHCFFLTYSVTPFSTTIDHP